MLLLLPPSPPPPSSIIIFFPGLVDAHPRHPASMTLFSPSSLPLSLSLSLYLSPRPTCLPLHVGRSQALVAPRVRYIHILEKLS
jgi:hypothetical protein